MSRYPKRINAKLDYQMRIFGKTFGAKLRALRKARKLSQERLAEKLDVDSITISRWERGVHLPEQSNLEKIANIFEIDSTYFIEESAISPITAKLKMSQPITNLTAQELVEMLKQIIEKKKPQSRIEAKDEIETQLIFAWRKAEAGQQALAITILTENQKFLTEEARDCLKAFLNKNAPDVLASLLKRKSPSKK